MGVEQRDGEDLVREVGQAQAHEIAGRLQSVDDGGSGQVLVQAARAQFLGGQQDGGGLRGLGAGLAAAGLREGAQLEQVGQR